VYSDDESLLLSLRGFVAMSLKPILLLAATVFLWGLWGYLGKLALLRGMKPISVFVAESVFGLIIGLAIAFLSSYKSGYKFLLEGINIYGFLSGFSLTLGLLTYYEALKTENIHIVVPVTSAYPAVAVLLGVLLLGEIVSTYHIAGISFIIIGVFLLLK
jgi:uncharacterized membrane protein